MKIWANLKTSRELYELDIMISSHHILTSADSCFTSREEKSYINNSLLSSLVFFFFFLTFYIFLILHFIIIIMILPVEMIHREARYDMGYLFCLFLFFFLFLLLRLLLPFYGSPPRALLILYGSHHSESLEPFRYKAISSSSCPFPSSFLYTHTRASRHLRCLRVAAFAAYVFLLLLLFCIKKKEETDKKKKKKNPDEFHSKCRLSVKLGCEEAFGSKVSVCLSVDDKDYIATREERRDCDTRTWRRRNTLLLLLLLLARGE